MEVVLSDIVKKMDRNRSSIFFILSEFWIEGVVYEFIYCFMKGKGCCCLFGRSIVSIYYFLGKELIFKGLLDCCIVFD